MAPRDRPFFVLKHNQSRQNEGKRLHWQKPVARSLFFEWDQGMRIKYIFLAVLFSIPAFAENMTVVGKWRTIDDKTGKPKSVIEITQSGDQFSGKIIQLIDPSEPHPLCKDCPGDKANQPIEGMEILWGLHETKVGQEWGDGKIMDPQNGKVYSCRLKPQDHGQKLEVRGFIGFSLLGRSQTWLREPDASGAN